MEEEWRDIAGYEGLYQVSDLGRIKSLDYRRTGRTQVLKSIMDRGGYLQVGLWKNGKRKKYLVHRLVAETFLPNPSGLKQVNHIDENKQNNSVDNMEWCTCQYNINHGTRNARVAIARSKPVEQLTKDGRLIAVWPSMAEATRQTGIGRSEICKCCNGHPQHRTAGGYKWQYVN